MLILLLTSLVPLIILNKNQSKDIKPIRHHPGHMIFRHRPATPFILYGQKTSTQVWIKSLQVQNPLRLMSILQCKNAPHDLGRVWRITIERWRSLKIGMININGESIQSTSRMRGIENMHFVNFDKSCHFDLQWQTSQIGEFLTFIFRTPTPPPSHSILPPRCGQSGAAKTDGWRRAWGPLRLDVRFRHRTCRQP